MSESWRDRIDTYLTGLLPPLPAQLRPFQIAMEDRFGLDWSIGTVGGWTLFSLARMFRARRVLDIGTCLGMSAAWLALAVAPLDGTVITVELEPERVQCARRLLRTAGLGERVKVLEGDARDLVPRLSGCFDLIFQDGEKAAYVLLLDTIIGLLAPGGLLIADDGAFPLLPWSPTDRGNGEVMAGFLHEVYSRSELIPLFLPLANGLVVAQRIKPGEGLPRHHG